MVNLFRLAPACEDESHVYGAACPDWWSTTPYPTAVDDWVALAEQRGVERVCCLLDERLDRFDGLLKQYAAAFGEDNVLHAPVTDYTLPDVEFVCSRVLPYLRESAEAERPVVVHCHAGVGRTGVVLAAWLVSERGHDPETAIERVTQNGRRPMNAVDEGNATEDELRRLLAGCR
jgi:protein-tyrosine phosphatase